MRPLVVSITELISTKSCTRWSGEVFVVCVLDLVRAERNVT